MPSRSDPIRILHFAGVINRYDFIDMVMRFADPDRFRMMACTFTDQSNIASPDYARDGIPHFILGVNGKKDFPRAIVHLANILRRERVDILHTHHYYESLLGTAAAMMARTPYVVVGRHYYDEIYLSTKGLKREVLVGLERLAYRRANAVIVPSTPIRELLIRGHRTPSEKVWVIPYGFDFDADRYRAPTPQEEFAVRKEFQLDGHFVVGNFGRHHRLKGQDDLLHGFARFVRKYPDARLLMVGDGPFHNALRALANQLGLLDSDPPAVTFTGWRKDARELMAGVDVVAHPTLHEAFPQLMIEAMAKAKPLIITNVAGPSDHLKHLNNAFIIPEHSSDAIYRALCWIRENCQEAQQMAHRGREYILNHLDIRKVIHRFQECYLRVAENGYGR